MIQIREIILSALEGALEGRAQVFPFYPEAETQLPAVSFYEASNGQYAQADGREYLTEIAYQIDIWGRSVFDNDQLAALIDEAMVGLGFERTFCHDLYDEHCQHKTMRYRGLVSPDLWVSQ